jgi:hypothetical protein
MGPIPDFQIANTPSTAAITAQPFLSTASVTETPGFLIVTSPSYTFQFNKRIARISSWTFDGTDLLTPQSNLLTFWRVPIDNDNPVDKPYWQSYGLDHLLNRVRSVETSTTDGVLTIATVTDIAPPILGWKIIAEVTYILTTPDILKIKTKLAPKSHAPNMLPKDLPRIGWEISIAKDVAADGEGVVSWFGKGPASHIPTNAMLHGLEYLRCRLRIWISCMKFHKRTAIATEPGGHIFVHQEGTVLPSVRALSSVSKCRIKSLVLKPRDIHTRSCLARIGF